MNIKDLKVGDELVCVDSDSFTRERISTKDAIDFVLTIDAVDHNSVYVRSQLNANHVAHFHIYLDELKFFAKKSEEQVCDFNALIDVAAQAYKDGIFSYIYIGVNGVNAGVKEGDKFQVFNGSNGGYPNDIKFIQSLYKETFVIECENDITRIKSGAVITLQNGNTVSVVIDTNYTVCNAIKVDDWQCYLEFLSLKGATVEQNK